MERIRGLSTDYIIELLVELRRRIGKESSEEKNIKMRQIQEELKIEYGRKKKMMQLTEQL